MTPRVGRLICTRQPNGAFNKLLCTIPPTITCDTQRRPDMCVDTRAPTPSATTAHPGRSPLLFAKSHGFIKYNKYYLQHYYPEHGHNNTKHLLQPTGLKTASTHTHAYESATPNPNLLKNQTLFGARRRRRHRQYGWQKAHTQHDRRWLAVSNAGPPPASKTGSPCSFRDKHISSTAKVRIVLLLTSETCAAMQPAQLLL